MAYGGTRPGRVGEAVAQWVHKLALEHGNADFDLPQLGEPLPASTGQYSRPHTRRLAETVASFDGYVFVTPE